MVLGCGAYVTITAVPVVPQETSYGYYAIRYPDESLDQPAPAAGAGRAGGRCAEPPAGIGRAGGQRDPPAVQTDPHLSPGEEVRPQGLRPDVLGPVYLQQRRRRLRCKCRLPLRE